MSKTRLQRYRPSGASREGKKEEMYNLRRDQNRSNAKAPSLCDDDIAYATDQQRVGGDLAPSRNPGNTNDNLPEDPKAAGAADNQD